MQYELNKSGIKSLAGFAYQIKVFAYYAFCLKTGMTVEFETIDDINLKTIVPGQLDIHSHHFVCKTDNVAIQVKHTKVTNSVAQQLLLNWILLESSSYDVHKYILLTEKSYQNDGDIFVQDAKKLYKVVIASNANANAVITKVKNIYKKDYTGFEKTYNSIRTKFEFMNSDDIDSLIIDVASDHFRRVANEVVFYQRLGEFLQYITAQIMDSVLKNDSFALTYKDFIGIIEDISNRFTITDTIPSYSNFKRINKIDLKDSKVAQSREFIQLKYCELKDKLIESNLMHGMYYHETSLKYMENNQMERVRNIEDTAFENFENVKFDLQRSNQDTPYERLKMTQQCPNSHAGNDQIRLKEKKKRIREIREELNVLQNSDDTKKIKNISKAITDLYMSVKDISSVVSDDMEREGFEIRYIKKGNILQPMIASDGVESKDSDKLVNYYIGSMARHTLIQLCGYFAFLDILLKNDKYPIIPMLVIDHISKPFDEKNSKAIGKIIARGYDMIGKENIQIFIFDDEDPSKLGINPDHFENLVTEQKTGFNPFYIQSN